MKIDFTIEWDGIDYTNKQDFLIKHLFFKVCKQHYSSVYSSKLGAFASNYFLLKKKYTNANKPIWPQDVPSWYYIQHPSKFLTHAINSDRIYFVHQYQSLECNKSYCQNALIEYIISTLLSLGCRYITKEGFEETHGKIRSWLRKQLKKQLVINVTSISFEENYVG